MVLCLLIGLAAIFGIVHHKNKKGRKMHRGCGCRGRNAVNTSNDQQYPRDIKGEYHDAPNYTDRVPAPPGYDERWPSEYNAPIVGDNKVQAKEAYGFDEKALMKSEREI